MTETFHSQCLRSLMIWEGRSFMKGLLMGALFCLIVSFLGSLIFDLQSSQEDHHHHHIQAASEEDLKKFTKAKMAKLSQQVRIYCIIMVQPKHLAQWLAANKTWAKHCDHPVFYTSESVKGLEAIDLKEKDLWIRLRKAVRHAHDNAGDLRWFLLVQPSTFAIIENLKYLLLGRDPSQPFYVGHAITSGGLDYVEYESGIVLSYEALRRLVEVFKDEELCPERWGTLWLHSEGRQLAICLRNTGVFAENGEDSQGKELFNSKSVGSIMYENRVNNPSDVVEGWCSDMAITFSGMSFNQMQFLMYGVYRLRSYGHDFHYSLEFLPPKGSDND